MCPSYFRIKIPPKLAMQRLKDWIDLEEIQTPVRATWKGAFDIAVKDGDWLGAALYIDASDEWTIFHDLTFYFTLIPTEKWLAFAGNDDFFMASYDDTNEFGKLLAIQGGAVQREFLETDKGVRVNLGNAAVGNKKEINSWTDIEYIMNEDELGVEPDVGVVWVFRAPDDWY